METVKHHNGLERLVSQENMEIKNNYTKINRMKRKYTNYTNVSKETNFIIRVYFHTGNTQYSRENSCNKTRSFHMVFLSINANGIS